MYITQLWEDMIGEADFIFLMSLEGVQKKQNIAPT